VLGVATDITERKMLEAQLRQAQKMEAVGRLAGGVAHDFNNLLSVILGYGNLLLMDPDRRDADRKGLEEICKAAERAGGLTRQLLAFSRKQVLVPEIFDLRDSVQDIAKMLGRLIGEDVELSLSFAKEACRVRADRGQIDQVITNLAVNSRDAMPQGGKLTVEVRHADFTEPMVHDRARIEPGPYVLLAVSDSGVGMNAETQSHVFEPFYTTKGPGEGTGLGLATVYGIVKQSGGYIWLYSEPGEGTTFKIYLPRTEGQAGTAVPVQGASLPGGSETILLVEDDEAVRGLAQLILEERGYRVLAASGGEEAERLVAGWEGPIHLLLSDVIMPGMNGREVADRLCPRRPEMRTIFMSGYTGDAVLRRGIVAEDSDFIQKPFTPTILAVKVRQVLDRAAPRRS
ncbi:MAG TPA: ATP-binding protein, partial [Candidatus Binatia bacterium]|nr:ATP-binding protein [Candidatus Binatia bacterium]